MNRSEFKEYYEAFKNIPVLTPSEEKELVKKIHEGDNNAYELFILSNMRLVISRVGRFCSQDDQRAMDFVADGTLGLIRAIDQFDPGRNFKFSTYAVWWIDSYMRKSIKFFEKETHATIKALKRKFGKAKEALKASIQEEPSDEEVAWYLKWPKYMLQIYQRYSDDRAMIAHNTLHYIPSNIESPVEQSAKSDLARAVSAVLMKLTPIEEDILRRHYGIGSDDETYKQIAEFYGLAKERIRQIENDALRKLFVILKERDIPADILSKLLQKDEDFDPFEDEEKAEHLNR